MQLNDHAQEFIGKLDVRLEEISRQLAGEQAPPSLFKDHYRALLEMARATGELSDFDDSWYIDGETGLLAVRLHLHIPGMPRLIVP